MGERTCYRRWAGRASDQWLQSISVYKQNSQRLARHPEAVQPGESTPIPRAVRPALTSTSTAARRGVRRNEPGGVTFRQTACRHPRKMRIQLTGPRDNRREPGRQPMSTAMAIDRPRVWSESPGRTSRWWRSDGASGPTTQSRATMPRRSRSATSMATAERISLPTATSRSASTTTPRAAGQRHEHAAVVGVAGSDVSGIEVADVTGDGRRTSSASIGGNSGLVNVFRQNTDGTSRHPSPTAG